MSATSIDRVPSGRRRLGRDGWMMRALLVGAAIWLFVMFAAPLYTLLVKSLQGADGRFVGITNYLAYFSTPALSSSIINSLTIATISTAITIAIVFPFAYALTRSCMLGKHFFRAIALIPLLAPSMLPAISFRYLFGNQGILNWVM